MMFWEMFHFLVTELRHLSEAAGFFSPKFCSSLSLLSQFTHGPGWSFPSTDPCGLLSNRCQTPLGWELGRFVETKALIHLSKGALCNQTPPGPLRAMFRLLISGFCVPEEPGENRNTFKSQVLVKKKKANTPNPK